MESSCTSGTSQLLGHRIDAPRTNVFWDHKHVYTNGHVSSRPCLYESIDLKLHPTADMRINTGKRMVACVECCGCLRDTAEYAGILQGNCNFLPMLACIHVLYSVLVEERAVSIP